MQSHVIVSFLLCMLVACGSSEAPATASGNTDDALGDSAATGELPEWQEDDTVDDDMADGSTAAPEDVDEQDAGNPDDVVAADTVDAGADEDTDITSPPDVTDDTVSSDDVTADDTADTPDTLDDSSGVATCAGVPIEPWRCPDGELIDHCACVEDVLVCEEDPFPRCAAAQCWDGQPLTCRALPPVCPEGQQVTLQDGCWRCVDPIACVPPEIALP